MLPNTTFEYTLDNQGNSEVIEVRIDVSDDSATDQDVLTHIQTESIYKNNRLVQLYEAERGVWMATFRARQA